MELFAAFLMGVCVTSLLAMVFQAMHLDRITRAYEAGKGEKADDPADFWKKGGTIEEEDD